MKKRPQRFKVEVELSALFADFDVSRVHGVTRSKLLLGGMGCAHLFIPQFLQPEPNDVEILLGDVTRVSREVEDEANVEEAFTASIRQLSILKNLLSL